MSIDELHMGDKDVPKMTRSEALQQHEINPYFAFMLSAPSIFSDCDTSFLSSHNKKKTSEKEKLGPRSMNCLTKHSKNRRLLLSGFWLSVLAFLCL